MTSEPDVVLYQVRPELEYSTQTHQGQTFVVVKDPTTERYFRFPGSQARILELLRTPIRIEALAAQASESLDLSVPLATLRKFLDSLDSRGLLDTPETRAKLAQASERKPRERNWLYMRLLSVDASRLFDWLAPRTRWCFTPAFHYFAAAAILTGLVITTLHAGSMVDDALSLLNLYGLVLIWFVVVGVGILHELAHGLTCRHFGGKVKELGFMLIYFQPAFYCDVTDAWMFPSRRERMWVTFAGGYFQLVLWGMAAIVWRIFAEDTLINWIAMTVIVFSGLQTLVNFNPLIKLDGYYMLSDYLEIPNLRAKALKSVRAWLGGTEDPLLESDNRRSLLTFGALSLTFSTLLLLVVYVNIYVLATSYFAFAGLTAFVVFAGFTLRRTAAEPAAGAGALVNRARLKKYRSLAVLGGLLLLTFVIPYKLRIPAEFTIRPGQEFQVRAPIDGTIDEILVQEGDKVHRGQVVAYLHNAELRERLLDLQGEYESKRAEFERLKAGATLEERQGALQRVETARQALENVRRNEQDRIAMESRLQAKAAEVREATELASRAQELYELGLGAASEATLAKERLNARHAEYSAMEADLAGIQEANDREEDLKRAELQEAEAGLRLLDAGARTDEIAQAEDEASNLYAQLMEVSQELQTATVKAELTGKVITPDLQLKTGERVDSGDTLLEIQALGTVRAELWVSEKDLADVTVGDAVALVVTAFPRRTFETTVARIAETARVVEGKTYIRVGAQLENEDGPLLADMTGHAKIDAGWHSVMYLMTRRLIRWINTEFWHLLP